jgi:hypothetical protein
LWSDHNYIDQAWANPGGCRLVKSHNWPDKFDEIEKCYSDDWIMLVYRPDLTSYSWWHEAGGFQIQYPDYKWYKDSTNMLYEISRSNQQILEYGCKNNVTWEYFTANWVLTNMGQTVTVDRTYPDVLVALIK